MNWYKIANGNDKKDHGGRKPYKILTIAHGVETFHGVLWAFTSEQARGYAINKYSKLRDDLEMGYNVVARLDKEQWQEIEEFRLNKEKMKEEQIQNAWWNK